MATPDAAVDAAPVAERPAADPFLWTPECDLRALEAHWARSAARPPTSAEEMRGIDRRAQRWGIPGERLMEHAGTAVAAAAHAALRAAGRDAAGPVLVLAGPGNNGGDGHVAARWLAQRAVRVAAVLVASEARPTTPDALRNWERLAGLPLVERLRAAAPREVLMLVNGLERAALVIDALLGTGVAGPLRDPIRSAVELTQRARTAGVPVLAIDTPTALDLSSGVASHPVVRADVTVTFHRPKHGLRTTTGRALAGRVLVAPIGIPSSVDPV